MNYNKSIEILKEKGKEKLINQFNKILEEVLIGIEKKEILSNKIYDIKYVMNHFVKAIYDNGINDKYVYTGKYQELPEELQYLSTPNDVRSVGFFPKKLNQINNELKKHPMFIETQEITNELLELVKVMDLVKEFTVKMSDKRKSEKEETDVQKEIYLKKLVGHKDNKKVLNLLEEKSEWIKDSLYKEEKKYLNNLIEKYKSLITNDETSPVELFKKNPMERNIMLRFVEKNGKKYQLINKLEAEIDNQAMKYAKEIVDVFIYKNSTKLAYIISTKNNMEEVTLTNLSLSRGYIECDLNIKFKDNSSFKANTSVVLSYSKFNKPFYRYPTIFKNVILENGEKMKNVSEQTMEEEFTKSLYMNKIKVK